MSSLFQAGARASLLAVASMFLAAGCVAGDNTGGTPTPGGGSGAVAVTFLTSDQPGVAPNLAPSLINAWGLAPFNEEFWIADAGTGKVSILDGKGVPSTGRVPSGAIDLGEGITGVAVTGVAALDTTSFLIHTREACAPAQLIFASETGKLIGVNPDLSTTRGFVVVDQSSVDANYKGVAVVQRTTGPRILAADFHNARIDVFDAKFGLVTDISFDIAQMLPTGFAPFNVMTFDNTVYVAYAEQDEDKEDEVAGPGLGFVAAFDTSGTFLGLAKGPALDAPWGMALARNFRPFPNSLLVGNFGDGHVTAIELAPTNNPFTLKVLGQLKDRRGEPIAIDGLWGLSFGAGVAKAFPDGLYFAAGPDDETHGLFGVIRPRSTH